MYAKYISIITAISASKDEIRVKVLSFLLLSLEFIKSLKSNNKKTKNIKNAITLFTKEWTTIL